MATRDVRNFKFLKEAIIQKFRNPETPSFKGIRYEPVANPNSIFGRIYTTFRELIDKKHLDLKQYLNIGDKSVLNRLYLNLKKDSNLKFLDDPDSTLNDQKYELSDQYFQGQSKDVTAAQQAEPAPIAHAGMPSAPAITTTPSQPRFIHNIPQSPTPTQTESANTPTEKAIKSDGEPIKPEAPQAFQKAFEGEPAEVLHPNRQPVPEAFNKAFKDAPEHTLNPNQAPPAEPHSKQSHISQPPFQSPPAPTAFANTAKNIASKTGLSFQGNVGKHLTSSNIGKGISGIGNIVKAGLGGGLEAAAPSLKRAFNGGLNVVEKMSRPGGMGSGGIGKLSKSSNRVALACLGLFFLIVLLGAFGATSGTTPTTGTIPVGISGDISSCKFTRAGTSAQFQSSLLLSYIQEASQKSTIPPAVLAAFVRVESPTSSNMSNDQITNYAANCAVSPTGALGIMQIQPPGTTSERGDLASCNECIDAGAILAGKTLSAMTREDYCDVRTSIVVGAGWILKKMSNLGLGDGTKWDPAWTNDRKAIETLVNTYYGGLLYPDYNTGPYNYADDVSTSIQSCQTQSPVTPPGVATDCPIPGGVITCGSQFTPVTDPYSNEICGHCGIGYPPDSTSAYCGYPGTKYAIDVGGNDLQTILLPKIGGNIVAWTYLEEEAGSTESIQKYLGAVNSGATHQTYYLQLHHTQPGSGNPNAKQSGDFGGKICGGGCNEKHTHIQVGSGGDNAGSTSWLDAAQYFCRQ